MTAVQCAVLESGGSRCEKDRGHGGPHACRQADAEHAAWSDDDRYRVPASTATDEQLALLVQLSRMPVEMSGLAFNTGAAVAFGLMGMAEAIRAMPGVADWTCRSCNTFNGAGALECDDCGSDWTP